MLNIKLLLSDIDFFKKKIQLRFPDFNVSYFLRVNKLLKSLKYKIENLQKKRNIYSKKIFLKKKTLEFSLKIKLIKKKIIFNKKLYKNILLKFSKFLSFIPNIPDINVPVGSSDKDNKIIYYWGIKKKYLFKVIDHVTLGKYLDELNFLDAALMSGPRFCIMKNNIATLYRAITQFMLDLHIRYHNYCEFYVPYLVKCDALYGTGQLPKFKDDMFYVYANKNYLSYRLALIPTGEVSLVNLFKDKILLEKKLPIKLVSNTPCFRSEAGSYGKNNRGLMRLHQFDKVELVQVVHPKHSMLALEKLTYHAERVLRKLNLPYRKILLCTSSMNFSSCKTYDLEVWSPYEKNYYEISSCSNTLDFQSRRINLRYSDNEKKKNIFPHIINGSGLAVGRTLIAILENYQVNTGLIKIPDVLVSYMNGIKFLSFKVY